MGVVLDGVPAWLVPAGWGWAAWGVVAYYAATSLWYRRHLRRRPDPGAPLVEWDLYHARRVDVGVDWLTLPLRVLAVALAVVGLGLWTIAWAVGFGLFYPPWDRAAWSFAARGRAARTARARLLARLGLTGRMVSDLELDDLTPEPH